MMSVQPRILEMPRPDSCARTIMQRKPSHKPAMYHHWRDLLFLHFPVQPDKIQRLVPKSLTVDLYTDQNGHEMAWIGVVAFRMYGIRPRGLPPLPLISAFPETNVRTYVHRNGSEPGVWFFSLDARPNLACRLARIWYREPYTFAEMYCRRDGDRVTYRSKRLEGVPAASEIVCQVGDPLASPKPGSLEYFLVERYQMYTGDETALWKARVWHEPYKLREAELLSCQHDLLDPLGIDAQPWQHACFCDGADTSIYPLSGVS